MRGLSLVAASVGYSSWWCVGFLLWWLLMLQNPGSRCAGFSSCGTRALDCRLSSCGIQAQLLCSLWDLPGPGLEPVSPALAGGFLTIAPPGKSWLGNLNDRFCQYSWVINTYLPFLLLSLVLIPFFHKGGKGGLATYSLWPPSWKERASEHFSLSIWI